MRAIKDLCGDRESLAAVDQALGHGLVRAMVCREARDIGQMPRLVDSAEEALREHTAGFEVTGLAVATRSTTELPTDWTNEPLASLREHVGRVPVASHRRVDPEMPIALMTALLVRIEASDPERRQRGLAAG